MKVVEGQGIAKVGMEKVFWGVPAYGAGTVVSRGGGSRCGEREAEEFLVLAEGEWAVELEVGDAATYARVAITNKIGARVLCEFIRNSGGRQGA